MHRHARPGTLLILVLAALAGAVVAVPATALAYPAVPMMSPANVAPHPDDGEMALAAAPTTQHLTVPTLFGLLAEAARPHAANPASGGVHPRHHALVAPETDPRQSRAPPAVTDH